MKGVHTHEHAQCMVQVSQLFCDIWIARYFAHKVLFPILVSCERLFQIQLQCFDEGSLCRQI